MHLCAKCAEKCQNTSSVAALYSQCTVCVSIPVLTQIITNLATCVVANISRSTHKNTAVQSIKICLNVSCLCKVRTFAQPHGKTDKSPALSVAGYLALTVTFKQASETESIDRNRFIITFHSSGVGKTRKSGSGSQKTGGVFFFGCNQILFIYSASARQKKKQKQTAANNKSPLWEGADVPAHKLSDSREKAKA